MKKICIVTNSFSGGGAERVAINLANYYVKSHDVILIAFNSKGPYKNHLDMSVKLIDLKCDRTRSVIFKLRGVLKRISPDCVLSVVRDANIITGLSCLCYKNINVVFREANTMHNITNSNFIIKNIYRLLMKISYFRANSIICNSNDTKDDLKKFINLKDKKLNVVGNPVISRESKILRKKNDVDEIMKGDVILSVGRLHLQKNYPYLLRSFAIARRTNNNLKLVILGVGDEKENLYSIAKDLNVEDCFFILGFKDNPFPYYKNAKVFVLSSLWEGFGNVLVEALYCGTNVIATTCPGGPKDILRDNVGMLVPLDNELYLANKMIELSREKINVKIKLKRAREYSLDSVAPKYLEIMLNG